MSETQPTKYTYEQIDAMMLSHVRRNLDVNVRPSDKKRIKELEENAIEVAADLQYMLEMLAMEVDRIIRNEDGNLHQGDIIDRVLDLVAPYLDDSEDDD